MKLPTPEFEEWLERQDIPVESTTEIQAYQDYLAQEFGISGGSLDVAAGVFVVRYGYMPELGIRPFEWTRYYDGEPFTMTRYGIKGYPGAWGHEGMLEKALEIAQEKGLFEIEEFLLELLGQP